MSSVRLRYSYCFEALSVSHNVHFDVFLSCTYFIIYRISVETSTYTTLFLLIQTFFKNSK